MIAFTRIIRLLTLTFVLFALFAIPVFEAQSATRDRKPKTQTRVNQSRHGRTASQRESRPKDNKRKLTARESAKESKKVQSSRREKSARRKAAAPETDSINTLRSRVQSMITMDQTAGEDPEVRRVALNALGNHAGTVVVMDPNTGRIYSVVNQQWALRQGFKPCSTIKLVTGLAGLNEGMIDSADTQYVAAGYKRDLTSALAHSNNEYFQQVGGRVGFEKMLFYARQLGLGEKTGINANNESAGRLPESKSGYAINHMSSHGDDFQVTAIQLATLVSAMTNGGKLLTPYIPHMGQEDMLFKPRVRRNIKFDSDVWSQMVPGMIGAVNYGSGRKAYDPRETIAGKTGTCIQDGTWVGLFASYAPLANPRLAVVVIGLGADGRGHFPTAVAGEIYRKLNYRFGTSGNEQFAKNKAATKPAAPVALVTNNDGANKTEAPATANRTTASSTSRGLWINGTPKGTSTVKSVLMSVPKRAEAVTPSSSSKTEQPATRPRRVSSGRL